MVKVSVITPFYNGSKFIRKCIDGVFSQTFDFEYIIIDDGSRKEESENLKKIVKDNRDVKIFWKENGKQASAINRGIKESLGEYVAFCDQDDWYFPQKLERQIDFLDKNKDIDLVYSDAFLGDEEGNLLEKTWMQSRRVSPCEGGFGECAIKLFDRNFICAPLVVMMRKKIFDELGGVNEKYTSAYDYDLWFRFLEGGYKIGYINEPLAVWRTHGAQESRNIRKAKRMQVGILLAFLKRNPKFFIKHPLLVFKKAAKTAGSFLLNKTFNEDRD